MPTRATPKMMMGGPAWVVRRLLVQLFLLSSTGQAFVLVLPTTTTTTTTTTTRVTFSRSSTNEQEESTLSLSADDWWQRGKSLQRQNDLAQAALALQKAIDLHGQQSTRLVSSLQTTTTTTTTTIPSLSPSPPPSIDWLWDLGQTWAQMGYVENAVSTFQQILLLFFVLEEEQGNVHHQNHTNTTTTTTTTTTITNSVTKTTRRQVKVALANVLLDGLGRKQDALDIFTEVCRSSSINCSSRPQPLAVMAGVTADSMGRHEVAHAFYWQGCTNRNETDVDLETALHLYTSCLRQGNVEKATQVRNRLLDHYASSVDYVLSTRVAFAPSMHYFTHDVLQLAMQQARLSKGLVLEFGVYHGKTIRMMADYFAKQKEEENITVHGFDTFTGIPRDWHYTPRGSYSTHGTLPAAPSNVQYHVGTFAETLPGFLQAHPHAPVRFMNIDCDLYASTKDVLDALHDRIVPGTIIVFDEYILNPHWQDDEFKAFQEAVIARGWKYEYCSISLASQQAVVRIL